MKHFIKILLILVFFACNESSEPSSGWTIVGLMNNQVKAAVSWDNKVVAATLGGGVYMAVPGESLVPANEGLQNLFVYSLLVINGDLYAGTRDGIFVRHEQGTTWQHMTAALPSETRAYSLASDGSHLFAGSRTGVFQINLNNTDDVIHLSNGMSAEPYVMSTSFENDVLYTGTQGGLYTLIGSDEWQRETGVPLMTIGQLAFAQNIVVAPTDGSGISVKTNNSWKHENFGLPSMKTFAAFFHKNSFYCGSDHGVYTTDLDFKKWEPLNVGLPSNTIVNRFALIDEMIYACTENGLYRLQ
ncbi:MAG TPA: hypothetical protein VD927_10235 [Chryseosolibacter sp.]|nr:hypothetical protein [Chryseosolibacter sp.]